MTKKEQDKELALLRKKLKGLEAKQAKAEAKLDKFERQLDDIEQDAIDARNAVEEVEYDIDDLEAQPIDEDPKDLVAAGEIPSPEQAELIKKQAHSYGVTFVRRKANKKGQLVLHSDRRFSSREEAEHHGKRFSKKHKHAEFSVCIVQKKANAWVNWKTGKTNPAL